MKCQEILLKIDDLVKTKRNIKTKKIWEELKYEERNHIRGCSKCRNEIEDILKREILKKNRRNHLIYRAFLLIELKYSPMLQDRYFSHYGIDPNEYSWGNIPLQIETKEELRILSKTNIYTILQRLSQKLLDVSKFMEEI